MKSLTLRTLLLLVYLLSTQFAHGQKDSINNTVLWKITGKKGSPTSYLFGSNHLFGASFLDTLNMVNSLFDSVAVIVGEGNMLSSLGKPPAIPAEAKYIPYDSLFSKKEYEVMQGYLQKIQMASLKELDSARFPAWRLFFIIHGSFVEKRMPVTKETDQSLDLYFQLQAVGKGKEVLGLDSLSPAKRAKDENIFGDPQQLAAAMYQIVDYAETGHATPDIKAMLDDLSGFDTYRLLQIRYHLKELRPDKNATIIKNLLTARNNAWMKVLPDLINRQSCLIVVGLAHLTYNDGLIVALRKRGYTVSPVAIL